MSEARIVGLSLVRNEDLYIEQVLKNVIDGCDELIVLDHGSTDRTPEILARMTTHEPKLTVHRIAHPNVSHDFISPLAGENVWILHVDGDELFDPLGLAEVRLRLLSGEFDPWWVVTANAFHCVEVDLDAAEARGYLSPPSRHVTKLYNFGQLECWDGPAPERLHGGTRRFRAEHSESTLSLHRQYSWQDSPLRVFHACFLRRSSRQRFRRIRPNPSEVVYGTPWERLRRDLKGWLGITKAPLGKQQSYMRGELVTIDPSPFFKA